MNKQNEKLVRYDTHDTGVSKRHETGIHEKSRFDDSNFKKKSNLKREGGEDEIEVSWDGSCRSIG